MTLRYGLEGLPYFQREFLKPSRFQRFFFFSCRRLRWKPSREWKEYGKLLLRLLSTTKTTRVMEALKDERKTRFCGRILFITFSCSVVIWFQVLKKWTTWICFVHLKYGQLIDSQNLLQSNLRTASARPKVIWKFKDPLQRDEKLTLFSAEGRLLLLEFSSRSEVFVVILLYDFSIYLLKMVSVTFMCLSNLFFIYRF